MKLRLCCSVAVGSLAMAMTCSVALEAQTLILSPTGLLTWTENETQYVVVSTESFSELWAPMGQPITHAPGQSSLAIQWGRPAQFFKLKPGGQFRDEFDGSRESWRVTFLAPAEASQHTFTYTNGALRIQGAANVARGRT
jgi:hypothetical protein